MMTVAKVLAGSQQETPSGGYSSRRILPHGKSRLMPPSVSHCLKMHSSLFFELILVAGCVVRVVRRELLEPVRCPLEGDGDGAVGVGVGGARWGR